MSAFLAGALFGALFVGAIFTVFITRARIGVHQEPDEWPAEFQPTAPVMTTRALIRERTFS